MRPARSEHFSQGTADSLSELLATVFEASTDAVLVLRPIRRNGHIADFECVRANSATERVMRTNGALGRRLSDLFPDVAGHLGCLAQVTSTGEPSTTEWEWEEAGMHRVMSVEARRVPADAYGDVLIVCRDVTEARTSAALIGELRDRQRELELQALHDPLTGCANRLLIETRLQHAIRRLNRYEGALAVIFVDLDDFKQVNDAHGHTVGDLVLTTIARRLREYSRSYDTVGRLGGDEFVLICEDVADHHAIDRIARRFVDACHLPIEIAGEERTMSVSVGVAIAHSEHTDVATLIDAADAAMYRAKSADASRIVYADPAVEQQMGIAHEIRTDLTEAIQRGHGVIEFEPVVRAGDGRTVAVQLSPQWSHPLISHVGAASLAAVVHEIGMGPALTDHIIEVAARRISSTANVAGEPHKFVIVDVDASVLCDPGFVERLHTTLEDHDVPPTAIWIAIDGTSISEHYEEAKSVIVELSELGTQIVRDNAGAPGSSLTYFDEVPFDGVRLHPALLDRLDDPDQRDLILAICNGARALQLHTIAAGVESDAEAAALQEIGVDLFQGPHITSSARWVPPAFVHPSEN